MLASMASLACADIATFQGAQPTEFMAMPGTSSCCIPCNFPEAGDEKNFTRQDVLMRGATILVIFPVLSSCASISQLLLVSDELEAPINFLIHLIANFVVVLLVSSMAVMGRCMSTKLPAFFNSDVKQEFARCLLVVGVFISLCLFEFNDYHKQTHKCTEVRVIGFLLWTVLYISTTNCILPVRAVALLIVNCCLIGGSIIPIANHTELTKLSAIAAMPLLGVVCMTLVSAFQHERVHRGDFILLQEMRKKYKKRDCRSKPKQDISNDDSLFWEQLRLQADIAKLSQDIEEEKNHHISINSHLSQPDTSEVGVLFQQLGKHGATQSLEQQLTKIANLGKKERWLIEGSMLYIRQDEIMGAGSFGIVVGGMLHHTPVAVKVPRLSDMGSTESYLHELANELRILRSLQHPNIVSFLGACVEPEVGDLALILELVEGRTIHDYMLDDRMAPSSLERYSLVIGICSGLCYLHHQTPKIVHGDLKGKNILVERQVPFPRAKLLDFGLSRILTKHAKPLGGTLEYMAPEVALRKSAPNCSADVFSFGCVAFFVITGRRPREDLDRREIVRQMAFGEMIGLPWPDTQCSELLGSQDTINNCVVFEACMRPNILAVYESILTWPQSSRVESCSIEDLQKLAEKRYQPRQTEQWYQSVSRVRAQLGGSRPKSTTTQEKRQIQTVQHTPPQMLQEQRKSNAKCAQGNLVFPTLAPTPHKTIIADLVTTMFGWNTMVKSDSCCALHHNVKLMVSLSSEMLSSECSNLGYDCPVQCAECGLVDEFTGKEVPARWVCPYHERESQLSMSQSLVSEMLAGTSTL